MQYSGRHRAAEGSLRWRLIIAAIALAGFVILPAVWMSQILNAPVSDPTILVGLTSKQDAVKGPVLGGPGQQEPTNPVLEAARDCVAGSLTWQQPEHALAQDKSAVIAVELAVKPDDDRTVAPAAVNARTTKVCSEMTATLTLPGFDVRRSGQNADGLLATTDLAPSRWAWLVNSPDAGTYAATVELYTQGPGIPGTAFVGQYSTTVTVQGSPWRAATEWLNSGAGVVTSLGVIVPGVGALVVFVRRLRRPAPVSTADEDGGQFQTLLGARTPQEVSGRGRTRLGLRRRSPAAGRRPAP